MAEQIHGKEDKKVLVAYFSYSGITKGVAGAIGEKTGAADTVEQMEPYDIIFVGYPVWWSDMPQIMYTFFDTYDFSSKTIISFAVHGGSGLSGTVSKIQKLEPNASVYKSALSIDRNNVSKSESKITTWLNGLNGK